MKKAQGMPLNVVIVAAIVVIVLVVLIVIFSGGMGKFGEDIENQRGGIPCSGTITIDSNDYYLVSRKGECKEHEVQVFGNYDSYKKGEVCCRSTSTTSIT